MAFFTIVQRPYTSAKLAQGPFYNVFLWALLFPSFNHSLSEFCDV